MIVDAYAHVGQPRFHSIADYRAVMAEAGISRSVLSSFDSCPDLVGLHDVLRRSPETFRVLGVPLGADHTEMRDAAQAQLAAGFSGLRLTVSDVVERPWLLDPLGQAGRIALVCGPLSAPDPAGILLRHLEKHSDAVVVGGHFAGAGDPRLLDSGPAADLFAHPRFFVVFSRHGGYPAEALDAWATAVLARTGWNRIMWGSEAPVLFWRNETVRDALGWVERLKPTEEQRTAFLSGNAQRLYFASDVTPGPLRLPFDPWQRAAPRPAVLWMNGVPVDQVLAGRLVHGWLAAGGPECGPLQGYLEEVLDSALPPLP